MGDMGSEPCASVDLSDNDEQARLRGLGDLHLGLWE